ncbi:pyrophosphatase PpaX [Hazenella coriacea]|uniref:Pyrophosphatase PpaX n=1 Tax=Hazenella coriacea TaxID=1179467 RepID=A0A4V2UVG0_9BACL|nr:pyrophosphatase PpaX [Hazenella coriacea]TCS95687.1 pyrophosphatase PpaX [Hazenella coriacea]
MSYRAILFDLDGTLLNTNQLILASFMHTLEHHCPGKYTEQDVLAIMGEPLIDMMRRFDDRQAEQMVETYQKHNIENHDHYVEPFPHVVEVIKQINQAGIPMAVVTNKRRPVVEMGLRLFGLDAWMDEVICVGDAPQAKPEPDLLLLAMERIQMKPEECLMVGDSRYDLMAAQKAGVACAGVSWSLHLDDLQKYRPDYMLDDLRDLLEILKLPHSSTGIGKKP